MANLLRFFVVLIFFSVFIGCSMTILDFNPAEREAAYRPIEKANNLSSSGNFNEREKSLDSVEIANRTVFAGKKGYKVTFVNQSPLPIKFIVKKYPDILGFSLPVRFPSVMGGEILVDTLMPGDYEVFTEGPYETSSKVYTVYSVASWDGYIKDYSHCTIVFGKKYRWGGRQYGLN